MWAEKLRFLRAMPGEAGLVTCQQVRSCLITGRPHCKGELGREDCMRSSRGALGTACGGPVILEELLGPGVGDSLSLVQRLLLVQSKGLFILTFLQAYEGRITGKVAFSKEQRRFSHTGLVAAYFVTITSISPPVPWFPLSDGAPGCSPCGNPQPL